MSASTVLVTLRGPFQTVDLELPGDVSVGELIPLLLEICGAQKDDSQACLQVPVSLQVEGSRTSLPLERTLIDANIYDGALLVLQTEHAVSSREESLVPQPFVPRSVQPSPETGGIGVKWRMLG